MRSAHFALNTGQVSTITDTCTEEQALSALDSDPLGVIIHYTLSKLLSIITTLNSANSGVTIANVFYVGQDGTLIDQWKALLRVMNKGGRTDFYAQSAAALCLATILTASCPSMQTKYRKKGNTSTTTNVPSYASAAEPLEALSAWVIAQLKPSTGNAMGTSVPAVMALLLAKETRHLFAASGGVKYLVSQLHARGKSTGDGKKAAMGSVQQLYELTFCLWCLTYELNSSPKLRADFAAEGAAVTALSELVSSAPREKVVRVALSSLVNLAKCKAEDHPGPAGTPKIDGTVFLNDMIACRLLKSIAFLEGRQFTDPDIVDDIKVLHKLLADNFKEMSRWEVYKNEVESGHLQWGSTHTETFFKENAKMMEGKDADFKLVKVLISLLTSSDEEIAAVACHDIGEFVRFYPNGRSIAKRLGAKELVMPLIEHDNSDLQRHALQCMSKMMVQNWEYVK